MEITVKGGQILLVVTWESHEDKGRTGSFYTPAWDSPNPLCSWALGHTVSQLWTLPDMLFALLSPTFAHTISFSWDAFLSHVCSCKYTHPPFKSKFRHYLSLKQPLINNQSYVPFRERPVSASLASAPFPSLALYCVCCFPPLLLDWRT